MALIKETTNRLIQHLNKKNPNLIENIKHPVVISSIENPNVDEKKDLENLKIIQWNSRKMKGKPKQDRIKIDIQRINPDIFAFQETNLKELKPSMKYPSNKTNSNKTNPVENDSCFEVEGYNIEIQEGRTGLIIGYKKSLKLEKIEDNICFGRNLEHQIYKVHISPKPITLINIYRNCTSEANSALDPQKLFEYMSTQKSAIAVGDFNAHHPLWKKYKNTDSKYFKPDLNNTGRDIVKALETSNIMILNTGQSTHTSGSAIDLTFATPDIASKANWDINDNLLSDHYGIETLIPYKKTVQPYENTKNYKNADWEKYQEYQFDEETYYDITDN